MTGSIAIDVQTLPPGRRHEEVFRAFDGLEPGRGLLLTSPHRPTPLLLQFQRGRPAQFDWNMLEDGPERFRTEIIRRSSATSRNITEYLQTDHRRLDALYAETERLVRAGSLADAQELFSEFVVGLNRHILVEEAILFPAFEETSGMEGGPTEVMRSEHVQIRRWMDSAVMSLSKGDGAGFMAAASGLVGVLGAHNMKEERVLYPMTDQFAGDDDARNELVGRMQAL